MHELEPLFRPRSVAIIGASSDPDKLGGRPLRFLKEFGFPGRIYPINPTSPEVQGLPAYKSMTDVPGEVDHAVIVVPAGAVEAALVSCAQKGVKIVQILSSGFAEAGPEGRAAQDRLVEIARGAGIRLTGPNALGAVSPGNGFFATFSTALNGLRPRAGDVAFATQSGAFGSCAYVMATLRGLGLSRVIATGNEADVDVADAIAFLAEDPETRVICAAIETCKDGARLRSALVEAARNGKPVVIMKMGATEQGAAAAATHTGSLAGNDAVFDAVFRECGAWRATSIEEMIDIACLVSIGGGLPRNDRVGIVTVSGGIGILLADAASQAGLALPPLLETVRNRVMEILPFAAGDNPLDTTAQVAVKRSAITDICEAILGGAGYGTLLCYLANNALAPKVFEETKQALVALRQRHPESLLVTVMPSDATVRADLEAAGVIVMEDPTRAIRAVAAGDGLRRRQEEAVSPPSPARRARESLSRAGYDEAAAKALLARAGIPVLEERVCPSPAEAGAAAEDLGFPVVAKILSPDILHKTEVGGVAVNLPDRAAVERACEEILRRAREAMPAARVDGLLIAPMITDGVETILGIHMDPVFGPMVMFGLGGVLVELFGDVAFASAPLSPQAAERLIDSVRGAKLLSGWRGRPEADRKALVEALCRLSEFAVAHADELAGLEVNPFLVRSTGGVALDAVVTVR